jgi:hypothetical protein
VAELMPKLRKAEKTQELNGSQAAMTVRAQQHAPQPRLAGSLLCLPASRHRSSASSAASTARGRRNATQREFGPTTAGGRRTAPEPRARLSREPLTVRARSLASSLRARSRRDAQALGGNENVARNGYAHDEQLRFGAQHEQGAYVESDYHRQQIDKAAMGASGTQKHVAKGKSGANDEWGDDELGDDLLPM